MPPEDQQLEVDFVRSEMPKIDTAFGIASRYDDQLALFHPEEPVYQLEEALSQYRNLDCSPRLEFNPKECSWDDVSRLLLEARSQYDAKGKGLAGSVRNIMRKAGDHAESITPVFQLIPDNYGLSILRSSLCWMFMLMKQAAKTRKKIFDVFEEIPRIIVEAESKKKHFPQLKHLADNLYDVLFKAMTKLIAYLLPKQQVSKIFPIFTNTPSGSNIEVEIESVRKAVSILKERANNLSEGLLVEIHNHGEKTGQQIQAELHTVRRTAVSTLIGTQALSHQVSQVEDIVQPIPEKIEGLQQSLDEFTERFTTGEQATINAMTSMANRAGIEAQNYMLKMLTDVHQRFDMIEDAVRRQEGCLLQFLEKEDERARTPQLTPQQGLLSAPGLLEIMAAPPEAVTSDLNFVVQQGLHFGPAQQSQAQSLLKKDRLWKWFSSSRSDLLLVHGNLIDASNDYVRVSSLSVVCATIASAISQRGNYDTIALYYFCGLHMSSIDDISGPQGLIRCLTARLIAGLKARFGIFANLNFLDGPYVEALQRRDVGHLCAVFRSILGQFPPTVTVYCILDGITWYERAEMLQDLFNIVQTLCCLVDGDYGGPVLKVLFTSPFRPRHIASDMPVERQIFLESQVMMLGEPSERVLSSYLGPRNYETPQYVVTGGRVRQISGDEEQQWTMEDYT
ncbi:hypothetical protein VP1G_04593 [Cytospora mali]|uniref:Uncharacterized protein n=1 Tax=Cytospora mali TaxID=578113 RepID=A0A194V018_CYTMA|nr:hypothetical protein VP1G_04593 [Valsa mali var. pyri (nom. inval.)]